MAKNVRYSVGDMEAAANAMIATLDKMRKSTEEFAVETASFDEALNDETSRLGVEISTDILNAVMTVKDIVLKKAKSIREGASLLNATESKASEMRRTLRR